MQSQDEATRAEPTPLSMDDIVERYHGEWLFVEVTARGEDGLPSHGMVIVHDRKRDNIQDAIMATLRAAWGTDRHFYLTGGFRYIRSDIEWQEILAKAARGGGRVGRKKR